MSKNGISMYDDFEKVKANHVPLSPLSFLPRAASFYPDKEAVVMVTGIILGHKLMRDANVLPQQLIN